MSNFFKTLPEPDFFIRKNRAAANEIHGLLRQYIDQGTASVMKQIWLRKNDHLYVLGDCIDRNSLCVLRLSATIIAAELAAV